MNPRLRHAVDALPGVAGGLIPLLVACFGLLHGSALAAQKPLTSVDSLLEELADPRSTYVFVAAHRGGWERDWENRAPENSLANIDKAVRMGFDLYETDIRQSSDGELVIMHDGTVDRTTNGSGRVGDLTLAQLKQLRLRYSNGRLSDELVPTFEEFLVRGNRRILFKADYRADLETLPEAVRLLQKHDMLGHVLFRFTWSEETARALHELIEAGMPFHPNLILFRTRNAAEVRAAVARFDLSTIEVAEQDRIARLGRKLAHRLRLGGVEEWLDRRDMSSEAAEAVRAAREAGVLLVTHSSGGPSEWRRLMEHGFRMFHTQRPELMTRWLREQGLRRH